jgi:hypothetical protein
MICALEDAVACIDDGGEAACELEVALLVPVTGLEVDIERILVSVDDI